MRESDEMTLASELYKRSQPGKVGSAHAHDARILKTLDKITDTASVDVVVFLLEDMERTNMKLLQNAATTEEMISCREFAKCCGMLIRKLKRANKIKKDKNKESEKMSQKMIREIEDSGL